MEKYYVTYGNGTHQANNYSVVEAEDYGEARLTVDNVTKGLFAFMYDEEEFAGQAEQYGLTEIPLQPQVYRS